MCDSCTSVAFVSSALAEEIEYNEYAKSVRERGKNG